LPDGTKIAYNVSFGGSEISTIYVLDVATGKNLPDKIDHIWGEIPASWLPDGKAFFYTQMTSVKKGDNPMLNMQARLHVLGESVEKMAYRRRSRA